MEEWERGNNVIIISKTVTYVEIKAALKGDGSISSMLAVQV